MKKFLVLLISCLLLATSAFADETYLYKSDVTDDLNGYTFGDHFEITSQSGYFDNKNLFILEPNERGLRFLAKNVPEYISTSYDIIVPYPTFLNEANTGAGYIENAAAIKQIKVTASTNRPYDEIILLYKTTPKGPIHQVKMPQDFNQVRSLEEFVLTYDNPFYEADVTKRDVKATPVVGSDTSGIYLVGFRVKTNAPSGRNAYAPYSIVCIKDVSIVYDKAFTDEQLALNKELKEDFGLDENAAMREKAIAETEEKIRLNEEEAAKMDHSDEVTETSSTSEK